MVLPNEEIIQDIRNLINEITGFDEEEENFYICEQYCLSHVMHDTYPSVNKHEVKKVVDGFILRFFIQGHFKVADGLDFEVKKFLSSDTSFRENPESDIQWVLLGLLVSLASNLTTVTKLPKMTPLVDNEKPTDEIDWAEYLREDLPNYEYQNSDGDNNSIILSDVESNHSQCSETSDQNEREAKGEKSDSIATEANESIKLNDISNSKLFHPLRQHIIDELIKRREEEISCLKDIVLRGNIVEELGYYMNTRTPWENLQIMSEFEIVGYVLKQFLTGQNFFKIKGITNPATCSLTEGTIKSYLLTIQPYVNMIAVFKKFIDEVSQFEMGNELSKDGWSGSYEMGLKPYTKYSNVNKINGTEKKTVPNVVKLYYLSLTEALNSFENKVLTISEFQNSYTLLQVLDELRPSFSDLNSLFALHLSAVKNWLNEPNWLCSVRILMSLYKAVLHSTSNRLGFLYMNMFLYCFQAYLNIIDGWVSCLSLNDPHDEFIIYRAEERKESGVTEFEYRLRPYRDELPMIGLKQMEIFDYLANKMIQVGHSIDVLHRMDRSMIEEQNENKPGSTAEGSLYKLLLKQIEEELKKLEKVIPNPFDVNGSGCAIEATETNSALCEDESPLIDNSKSNAENSISKKTYLELKNDFLNLNSDLTAKEMALNEFCLKLCQNEKCDLIEKSIWPLSMIIDAKVKIILNGKLMNTCNLAKDLIVKDFQLKTHIRLLRNIFLFNEPYLIQSFLNALFNQEFHFRNCYILTARLRECIESRFKDQTRYLNVTMDESLNEKPLNILDAVDRITINYKVDWPLKLIFTPKVMYLYNNVFRHLFKIHWAHETLCKLHFNDGKSEAPENVKSCCRRLELLRFWCLSSLARLRSYFMAQISIPFDLQPNSYQHFKHIIEAHEEFITKVHSRCLLDEENADGKELIFNVLIPLCHDVYRFWCTGRAIPVTSLTFTEDLFFKSQKQFPSLMSRLEEE